MLVYIGQVVSCHELKGNPDNLCLGFHCRRLYIADNDRFAAGRVVVLCLENYALLWPPTS